MIHPCEPTLKRLLEIKETLTNTDEDIKKRKAITSQIKRHQEEISTPEDKKSKRDNK